MFKICLMTSTIFFTCNVGVRQGEKLSPFLCLHCELTILNILYKMWWTNSYQKILIPTWLCPCDIEN